MLSKRRLIRLLLIGVGVAILLVAVATAVLFGPFWARVEHFSADPAGGYHADFYLYVSPVARTHARAGREVTLLVQPNNSGINSDDPAVHRRDAWWTCYGRKGVADELGVVLLVPAFVRPSGDWQIYTHALDRDALTTTRPDLARLDLQLLTMVERARAALADEGIKSDEKFLLQGYSASGMFVNRFAAIHPRRVKGVAAGSPGGWPIAPVAQHGGQALPYPAGVADLEQLIGQPFDREAWQAVPQLIVMGSLDDNDSLDFGDGWDDQQAAVVNRLFGDDPLSRWDDAEQLYREAEASAEFLLVDGIGHDRRKLQTHTTEFFARLLEQ